MTYELRGRQTERVSIDGPAVNIRTAVPADADVIGAIHHREWNFSVEGVLTPELVARRTVVFRQEDWRRRLSDVASSEVTLVAELPDEGIVGFVSVGGVEGQEDLGEVYKLYVRRELTGRGVGAALLGAGTDVLRGQGAAHAVLWMLSGNDAAARFYLANGWSRTSRTDTVEIDQTDSTHTVEEFVRAL